MGRNRGDIGGGDASSDKHPSEKTGAVSENGVRHHTSFFNKIKRQVMYFWAGSKNCKSDCSLRHVSLSVRQSAWNNSAPTGRISMKIYI